MNSGMPGRHYQDQEIICGQGELGECLYLLQQGQVELTSSHGTRAYRLAVLREGQFWGEAALIERDHRRTATARAIGHVCVLMVDKRTFFSHMHDDPSLVLKIMRQLLLRIQKLENALVRTAGTAPFCNTATNVAGNMK